jgi:hypothetical protein
MTAHPAQQATGKRLPRYQRASTPPAMQLTARDIRIVNWVYEMRFATREQIERLEFSPSTASYCKRRLSLLFHHGYLSRKFIHAPGSFGSAKAIHCLASKGARLLAHELKADIDWRPADNQRELYFLQHTLRINDFRVCAILAARQLGLALDWTDERTLRQDEMKDYVADPKRAGRKLAIVPDGYFRLEGTGVSAALALELDRATIEERPFKEKVRAYGEWKISGKYAARHGSESLRVLFVVADSHRDPHRLARIKAWCEAEGGRSLFWFSSLDRLNNDGIFTEPVWQVAGRDGRYPILAGGETWSGGSRQLVTTSPSRLGSAPGSRAPS